MNESQTKRPSACLISTRPTKWFARRYPKLVDRFGSAVLEKTNRDGEIFVKALSQPFVAATLGPDGCPEAPTVHLAKENRFYGYDPDEGIYVPVSEAALMTRLGGLLRQCAKDCAGCVDTTALEFRLSDATSL